MRFVPRGFRPWLSDGRPFRGFRCQSHMPVPNEPQWLCRSISSSLRAILSCKAVSPNEPNCSRYDRPRASGGPSAQMPRSGLGAGDRSLPERSQSRQPRSAVTPARPRESALTQAVPLARRSHACGLSHGAASPHAPRRSARLREWTVHPSGSCSNVLDWRNAPKGVQGQSSWLQRCPEWERRRRLVS